jgi:hypothetical protein
MSENYLQFSTKLNVGSAENAQTALKLYKQLRHDDAGAYDEWSADFQCEITNHEHLWLQNDDKNTNLDHVVAFVCKLAQQFGLKGKWGFSWADIAEFGGGAVAIDLATGHVEVINTHVWLEDHTKSGSRVREGTASSLAAFL